MNFYFHPFAQINLISYLNAYKRFAYSCCFFFAEQRNPAEIPENVLCRVCMVQERGVVFLPCGHLATCPSCAASVTECVMCRTPIAGTLRTFLS